MTDMRERFRRSVPPAIGNEIPTMKVTARIARTLGETPLLVLFVPKGSRALALPPDVEVPAGFRRFEGEPRAVSSTWAAGGPAARVLLVGLGPARDVGAEGLRRAAAVAARTAEELGAARATFWIDEATAGLAGGPEVSGRALAEGAWLGAYRYTGGKSQAKPEKCRACEIVGGDAAFRRAVKKGVQLAEANGFARDLQNRPANEVTPTFLASEARKLARKSPRITCRVLGEAEMKELGMGLLLSVAQGSTQPAKLIHLTYRPKARSRGKVCLVGKGLTFDAGGISIKPAAKMDEMRYDMSGGAAVLGAFHALCSIDVPWEVHGVVPATENLIDGNATKPGDIHRAMDGQTVEVLNTDAEGRLVLADALCYAKKKIEPDAILDLATLTGSVIHALGHEVTAIYPSTGKMRDELVAAGEAVGETVWPMPLLDVHREAMRGRVADLANISSPSVGAGSVTGAAFLAHFVEDGVEWCHLDIAGTAWGAAPRDWVGGPQGTGVGTRLVIEYLEARA